jgi:hypothetical protein
VIEEPTKADIDYMLHFWHRWVNIHRRAPGMDAIIVRGSQLIREDPTHWWHSTMPALYDRAEAAVREAQDKPITVGDLIRDDGGAKCYMGDLSVAKVSGH